MEYMTEQQALTSKEQTGTVPCMDKLPFYTQAGMIVLRAMGFMKEQHALQRAGAVPCKDSVPFSFAQT